MGICIHNRAITLIDARSSTRSTTCASSPTKVSAGLGGSAQCWWCCRSTPTPTPTPTPTHRARERDCATTGSLNGPLNGSLNGSLRRGGPALRPSDRGRRGQSAEHSGQPHQLTTKALRYALRTKAQGRAWGCRTLNLAGGRNAQVLGQVRRQAQAHLVRAAIDQLRAGHCRQSQPARYRQLCRY